MGAVTRFYLQLFLLCSVAVSSSAIAEKDEPLTHVADLRYGVALYHYYQSEYLDGLTELLIAKERGGIQGHGDNPDIMEGGFALAYGLERYAADIFSDVLDGNVPENAQVAAWYYLARMRYMRGDWSGADYSLEQVAKIASRDKKSTRNIESDLSAQKINLLIKQDDFAGAEDELKRDKVDEDWLPYLQFNLASLAARQQNFADAIKYYKKLADKEFPTEEYRALYDKAMTAAGYCFLLTGEHRKAMRQFSKVRLESPLVGRALLGYGWAATEIGLYREALSAWQKLAQADLVDENSQEALMAVPYAYEKMSLDGIALQQYKIAVSGFEAEIARLDDVIANLSGDSLLEALEIESADGIDWLNYQEKNQLSPTSTYLVALYAREEFQMRIQQMRELLTLQKNNREWQSKMAFYSAMLDERAADRDNKSGLLAKDKLAWQISDLEDARKNLSQQIERIGAEKDYFALAQGDEADLIKRTTRSRARVPYLRDEDPFIEDSAEALRRYYGILLWQASEKFSDRLWRAVKTLNSLDSTIVELKKNYHAVEDILQSAPDLAPYRARINDAQVKLEAQSAEVDLAVAAAKADLRTQVVGTLSQQRDRIQSYLAQSRLSVARLYDKSLKHSDVRVLEQKTEAEMERDK
ncbi:tetratricopeptide repeat protein [Teredinibacter turnerae]|uniref:tetratricopeptide repeat protein n=1 Tax=Teredinibacter turnerae TaxID=2426 RepID=UPI000369F27E|nr:hypothetical protein [Teredinibacter turnerae]